MTRRVDFRAWGRMAAEVDLPAYAMRRSDETNSEAVCRAVARRTGLAVVTCRQDGVSLDRGQPYEAHYQLTLGRPVSRRLGGGYSVEGELWVAVPLHSRAVRT